MIKRSNHFQFFPRERILKNVDQGYTIYMGLSLLVPLIFLAVVGTALLLFILSALFSPMLKFSSGWSEQFKFRQREQLLRRGDELVAKGQWQEALPIFERAFLLEAISFRDTELMEKVNNHHIALLGRFVSLSEHLSRRLSNLATFEELLTSRGEMLRALREAVENKRSLLQRRRGAVPQWAVEEYDKKLREVTDRLKTNRKSVELQIEKIVVVLRDSAETRDITYH